MEVYSRELSTPLVVEERRPPPGRIVVVDMSGVVADR